METGIQALFIALFARAAAPFPPPAEGARLLVRPWAGILAVYLCAYAIHRLGARLARQIMRLRGLAPRYRTPTPERRRTIQALLSSVITFIAFGVATFAAALYFIHIDTLVWVIGLFSAAFGLAAGPSIRDVLTGTGFLFADTFSVGEKVEIAGIEGIIESIDLRATTLLAPTGELFMIPNGEIRTVRNFSRGRFSPLSVSLRLPTARLPQALEILRQAGQNAATEIPDLIEPWQVIAGSDVIGDTTELELIAKARLGKAAAARPLLLTLVHNLLASNGIVPGD